jgi:hypothetical protein
VIDIVENSAETRYGEPERVDYYALWIEHGHLYWPFVAIIAAAILIWRYKNLITSLKSIRLDGTSLTFERLATDFDKTVDEHGKRLANLESAVKKEPDRAESDERIAERAEATIRGDERFTHRSIDRLAAELAVDHNRLYDILSSRPKTFRISDSKTLGKPVVRLTHIYERPWR